MSSSLYYRPSSVGEKLLPDELKLILRDSEDGIPYTVDDYNIEYFKGLADAKVKGARKLVIAYEKYGTLELIEEF